MSFVEKGQLGTVPGLQVETYYYWLNKSVGYRNTQLAFQTSGKIASQSRASGFNGNWTSADYSNQGLYPSSGSGHLNGVQIYFDSQQNPRTGSAVTSSNSPEDGTSPNFDENYYSGLLVETGSVEGNTRIRVKASFGVNITTSSINDIFASAANGINQQNKDEAYNYGAILKLKIYRLKDGESIPELIGEGQKSINTFNDSLLATGYDSGYFVNRANFIASSTNLESANWFHWAPNQVAYLQVVTDYFDAEPLDKIYAKIELPNETTASRYPVDLESDNYFTESLSNHASVAAVRRYGYFGGLMIMNQETPEGSNFLPGITGVTASYFTSHSDGSVKQTVWNYTGSYWVGYNNYSSSDLGIGAYITASTQFTQFYGGNYIQSNPGTEPYNVVNASTSITSSLGTGVNKQTWDKFGFNPIRLSFYPPTRRFHQI